MNWKKSEPERVRGGGLTPQLTKIRSRWNENSFRLSFHTYLKKHHKHLSVSHPEYISGLELFKIQKFSLSLWTPYILKLLCSALKSNLGRKNLAKDFTECLQTVSFFTGLKAFFSYSAPSWKHYTFMRSPCLTVKCIPFCQLRVLCVSVCLWQEHSRWNQPSCFLWRAASSFIPFVFPLSMKAPRRLRGEQMRLTFVRRTWDGVAVAC